MSAWQMMNPPPARLADFGCTAEQWREMRDLGNEMIKAGKSVDSTPLRAFQHQRNKARRVRGIEWKLTLPEWWGIWQASGKWSQRGDHAGQYVMGRHGDVGPYALDNVSIITCTENHAARHRRARNNGLPAPAEASAA